MVNLLAILKSNLGSLFCFTSWEMLVHRTLSESRKDSHLPEVAVAACKTSVPTVICKSVCRKKKTTVLNVYLLLLCIHFNF